VPVRDVAFDEFLNFVFRRRWGVIRSRLGGKNNPTSGNSDRLPRFIN
jgi:hypothetical protein